MKKVTWIEYLSMLLLQNVKNGKQMGGLWTWPGHKRIILVHVFEISIDCLRLRVCCVITSKVEKCCLKYKNRISTPRRLLYNKFANKNAIGIYQVDFHPLKRIENLSVCNRFRPHPSFFDFPYVYFRNKTRTCLDTILVIIFCDQISTP
jgi:hypothetical protein